MGISMALFMALRKGPLQMTAVVLFRPQKSVVRRALALGIPVFLERACFSCGQLIVTHMVAGLGNIALAANHVAVTAEAISYLPAQGVSFAVYKRQVLARRYGVLSGRIGLCSGLLAGIFLFFCAEPLAGLFSSDPEVIALAADMLRIVAVSEPLYGLSIVLGGVLRGAGDSRTPFLIVLVGVWAVRLPLGPILLVRCGLDLAAIWIAMVADLMLRGVLCQFFVCKINWPRRAALVSGKPTTKS